MPPSTAGRRNLHRAASLLLGSRDAASAEGSMVGAPGERPSLAPKPRESGTGAPNLHGAAVAARGSFAFVIVWIAAATGVSWTGPSALHAALAWPFAMFCHREPARVLMLGGATMPLCSRCAGVWIGLCVGAVAAWPRIPIGALRWIVATAAAAMVAHVIAQDLGAVPLSHAWRMATGLFLSVPVGGAIGGVMVRELGPLGWGRRR